MSLSKVFNIYSNRQIHHSQDMVNSGMEENSKAGGAVDGVRTM